MPTGRSSARSIPRRLGLAGRDAWREIWDSQLHALLAGVVRTGEAFWAKDLLFETRAPRISGRDVLRRVLRSGAGGVRRRRRCLLHRHRNDGACGGRATHGLVEGPRRAQRHRAHGRRRRAFSPPRRSPPSRRTSCSRSRTWATSCRARHLERRNNSRGRSPSWSRTSPFLRRARRRGPQDWWSASIPSAHSTISTVRSLIWWPISAAPRSPTRRAHEQERQRAEALAELDRAKTTFFSNVSHEFRTPLTLLVGPLEDGLADAGTPLPPVHRERQEVAHRNALRLLRLVNTLLDFSRIEAGRIDASFEADGPRDVHGGARERVSIGH